MIYCGIDIIEVDRIKEAIINAKGFKEKIFTKNEINCIDKINSELKYQKYAGRFAAKEAFYKAISKLLAINSIEFNFSNIEIINEEEYFMRPKVVIKNKDIQKYIEKNNILVDVSISHIKDTATAIVTLSC